MFVMDERIVLHCERQPGENFARVYEIEVVFSEVRVALRMDPLKTHDLLCVYLYIYSMDPSSSCRRRRSRTARCSCGPIDICTPWAATSRPDFGAPRVAGASVLLKEARARFHPMIIIYNNIC